MRTHGLNSTYGSGCRCEPCREAHRIAHARSRERAQERLRADPGLAVHGTMNAYIYWGCRCTACTAHHSAHLSKRDAAVRARRQAGEQRLSRPIPHGTANGYIYHRCRCEPCREAKRASYNAVKGRARERLKNDPSLATHARLNTYVYWGCRCMSCREAAAAAARQRRRNARAQA